MLDKETVMTGAEHPGTKPILMHSKAGWYIGFTDETGLPYSRETCYFSTDEDALKWLSHLRVPYTKRIELQDKVDIAESKNEV